MSSESYREPENGARAWLSTPSGRLCTGYVALFAEIASVSAIQDGETAKGVAAGVVTVVSGLKAFE